MCRKKLINQVNKNDIIFKALGGVSEVGATSYFIKWKRSKILIDAGKRLSGRVVTPEYDEIGKEIDIFIITHVHQDHVGSLMEYFDYFNIKTLITTPETKEVIGIVLNDTKKILMKKLENNCYTNPSDEKLLELYSEDNIQKLIDSITVINYNQKIKYQNFSYTLLNTSHLIGSCGIIFEDNSYRLFITSDFTESQKFFHPYTNFEIAYDGKVDTMVTETTYGANEEGAEILKESTLSDLESKINKIFGNSSTESRGGNILIPAFAIGRTQEIILALLLLIKSNRIPYTTKIRIPFKSDGRYKNLAQNLTEQYYATYKSILEEELGEKIDLNFIDFVNSYLSPINLQQEDSFFDNENQILIGTPGMLGEYRKYPYSDNDEVFGIIKISLDIFKSERHGIIFAGYQSPYTLGGKIQQSAFGEEFIYLGQTYQRATPHVYKVTFPGHVSAKGIMNLTKKINPANIILTHGDIKASLTISKTIENRNINVIVPDIEEDIYLMDNGKSCFFSSHHKQTNIILSLDPLNLETDIKQIDNRSILQNVAYSNLKLIIVLNEILKSDKAMNHIDFLINIEEQNMFFYKKLQEELTGLGVSSDFVTIAQTSKNDLILFYELLEFISEKALEFKEKFKVFLLYQNFLYSYPFFIISQILNQEVYHVNTNNLLEHFPLLPIDFKTDSFVPTNKLDSDSIYTKTMFIEDSHLGKSIYSDFYELMDRITKYKNNYKSRQKKIHFLSDSTPNQLPFYDQNSILFKRDLFSPENNSLWGKIENIYDVKNNVAVKIIQYIINELNENIKEIKFTNYVYNYDNHRFYGEIIGTNENTIFYKMVLENGIQFLLIRLAFKVNIDEAIQKIGKKYER